MGTRRAALHLDLFEQPGRKRVFQHPARSVLQDPLCLFCGMAPLSEFLQFLSEESEPPFQQLALFLQHLQVLLARGEGRPPFLRGMPVMPGMAGAVMPFRVAFATVVTRLAFAMVMARVTAALRVTFTATAARHGSPPFQSLWFPRLQRSGGHAVLGGGQRGGQKLGVGTRPHPVSCGRLRTPCTVRL
jgi:hypothetical protein